MFIDFNRTIFDDMQCSTPVNIPRGRQNTTESKEPGEEAPPSFLNRMKDVFEAYLQAHTTIKNPRSLQPSGSSVVHERRITFDKVRKCWSCKIHWKRE